MNLLIDNTVTEEVASLCVEGEEVTSISIDEQDKVAELLASGSDEDLNDIVKIVLHNTVPAIEAGVVPNVIIAIGHESADDLNDLLEESGVKMTRVNKELPSDDEETSTETDDE